MLDSDEEPKTEKGNCPVSFLSDNGLCRGADCIGWQDLDDFKGCALILAEKGIKELGKKFALSKFARMLDRAAGGKDDMM